MTLEAIRYKDGTLEILDQLLLPAECKYIGVSCVEDGYNAIKNMQVRGAPALAIVGALSFAVELPKAPLQSCDELLKFCHQKLDYLVSARPTAVNMQNVRDQIIALVEDQVRNGASLSEIIKRIESTCADMLHQDVSNNKQLGDFGAEALLHRCGDRPLNVLTHCNTGSLATGGYGTALGVIRSLHSQNRLQQAFCTETRPFNQGSRLTAFELVHDCLPSTLICDDMVAALMKHVKLDAVVVGADRVVANGDTANKIGTYGIAVLAKHHNIPFYIALPTSTFNPKLKSGQEIEIEERPEKEMVEINGTRIAASGINCWNPAFDVTPAHLIAGYITEFGVFEGSQLENAYRESWTRK